MSNNPNQLFDGDATFAKSFSKISFGDDGGTYTAKFNAGRGKKFVVLLLGEVDAKATDADLEDMLARLGYVSADQ